MSTSSADVKLTLLSLVIDGSLEFAESHLEDMLVVVDDKTPSSWAAEGGRICTIIIRGGRNAMHKLVGWETATNGTRRVFSRYAPRCHSCRLIELRHSGTRP